MTPEEKHRIATLTQSTHSANGTFGIGRESFDDLNQVTVNDPMLVMIEKIEQMQKHLHALIELVTQFITDNQRKTPGRKPKAKE